MRVTLINPNPVNLYGMDISHANVLLFTYSLSQEYNNTWITWHIGLSCVVRVRFILTTNIMKDLEKDWFLFLIFYYTSSFQICWRKAINEKYNFHQDNNSVYCLVWKSECHPLKLHRALPLDPLVTGCGISNPLPPGMVYTHAMPTECWVILVSGVTGLNVYHKHTESTLQLTEWEYIYYNLKIIHSN